MVFQVVAADSLVKNINPGPDPAGAGVTVASPQPRTDEQPLH